MAQRPAARFRAVVIAAGGFGISCVLAAVMPTFWTFAATLVLLGYCTSTLLSTANGFVQTTSEPNVRGRVLSIYFAILMGGTPIGAPIVGAVADALGARWGLGVAAVSGFVAFGVGLGWLLVERRLRVHLRRGAGPHLTVTHAGRPGIDDDPGAQLETLTAPITVLRRGPVILSEPNSAPQSGALSEGLTGPIGIIDDPAATDSPGEARPE